jgi:hypothetical protein
MFGRIACAGVLLLGVSGCFLIQGHAEMVKRERGGGVLALKGDHDKAMADAKKQMADNCGAGYEIVGEEMTKVGEKTDAAEDTELKKKGAQTTSQSVTQDVKEYRITYQCTGAAAPTSGGEAAG